MKIPSKPIASPGSKISGKNQNLSPIRRTFPYEEWLAPQWGMEFGEPLKVKVRFSNRAQTMAKVRKDTAHRKCRLTEEEGGQTLLYEDTGIGKNEFIAWILGFGSAAEVLEPL
ncbi:MAG: WYL domain-containing protein [Desulfitobacteriia bacterium]